MEKFLLKKSVVKDFILIIIGTTLLALAINVFFETEQVQLVTGGVTGLAIVVKKITSSFIPGGIPLWLTNLAVNIPLFLLAIMIRGKDFGMRSLFATFYLSFALWYTGPIPAVTDNLLLSSIYGGILAGAGLGIVFLGHSTTGGTDLAGSLLQKMFKHYTVAQLMFVLDALIIACGYFVFGMEKAMYAIIAVYLTAKIVDAILEGLHFSKAAFIISEHYDQIASELLVQLDRGVTGLHGKGMYTGHEKQVLFCIVSKKQIVILKEIVASLDSKAFVIVADVREVMGEGFKEYKL